MSETLRERVARRIESWLRRDADGNGIVRAYDSGLPTQADWKECACAALAAALGDGD